MSGASKIGCPPGSTVHRVWVDADSVGVDLPLPDRAAKVDFNYLNSVLARVR